MACSARSRAAAVAASAAALTAVASSRAARSASSAARALPDQVREVALEPGGPLGEDPLGFRRVLGQLLGRVVGRRAQANGLVTLALGGQLGAPRVGGVLLGLRQLPPGPAATVAISRSIAAGSASAASSSPTRW